MNTKLLHATLLAVALAACSSAPPAGAPKAEPAAPVDQSFRATPPEAGPVPEFEGPVPERRVLANGLTVFAIEKRGLPLVAVSVVVRSGSAQDPKGEPGLAGFLGDMLKAGTTTRSATQLADEIETLGTELAVSFDEDSASVSTTMLRENFGAAFDILADVVQNPALAPQEIERVRGQRLAALTQERDSPPRIARRTLHEVVYGDHPYGHVVLGSPEAVKKITRQSLRAYFEQNFRPHNAAVVVVGDLSSEEAFAEVQKRFGAWKGTGEPTPAPPAPQDGKARVILVSRPEAPQSQLILGHVGVPRSHPDYFPLVLANAILGGQFNSRINMNLREAKGYTYGASSSFEFGRAAGPFTMQTSVRTEVTLPAIKELLAEMERIRTGDITEAELQDAKNNYTLSLPGYFQSVSAIAGIMGNIFVFDLPLDYYRALPERMRAVTVESARRVAKEHLAPERLSIVVVGDSAKIAGELEQLGRGAVEVRTMEGSGS